MSALPPLPPTRAPAYQDFVDRDNDERLLAWLLALRQRFRHVNSLALDQADEDRADFPIDQLFVAPTARWEQPASHEGAPPRTGRTSDPARLIAARKRVLLLGTTGAGKSTLVRWLCWMLAERSRNALHERIGALIPLPFILRDLPISDATDSWEALVELLAAEPGWPPGMTDILDAMGRAGQLLVVLDGWDEVADTTLRRGLRAAVLDGMRRYPASSFVLTSRPRGYAEVPLVEGGAAINELVHARLEPLDGPAQALLVRRWYGWRAPADVERLSRTLTEALLADPALGRLAGNPLLLTLLAVVFRRFRLLPRRRSELLAHVVDAVLSGDASRVGPPVSLAGRRRLLQELALFMNRRRVWGASRADRGAQERRPADDRPDSDPALLQAGTTITRPLARSRLARRVDPALEAAAALAPDLLSEQLLDWCVRRSGLLVPRPGDRLAFAHLLLQDWLTAGAFLLRLRDAWVDPAGAEQAVGELRRWIFRSAGGTTVAFVVDVLREEQPAMARRLGDELFAERAARYLDHRRLAEVYSDVWRFRGGDDPHAWPDWVVADPARVQQLAAGAPLTAPAAGVAAVYICHRPDLASLAPLLDSPPPGHAPVRRTVYLLDTGVEAIPTGLQWRVVDELGVCYTPETGPLRPPHVPG